MKSGFNVENIDSSVRPGNDFFQFAAGNWIKNNPIPPSETRWSMFDVLMEKSLNALHDICNDILKQTPLSGSEESKLKILFQSGMDETRLQKEGIAPLQKELEYIKNFRNTKEIARILGRLRLHCFSGIVSAIVELDEKDSGRYLLHLYQDGLGLPNREYYLRADSTYNEIRKKYQQHIEDMLVIVGLSREEAGASAKKIIEMETQMARASTSQEELRDVEKQYNKMSLKELCARTPQFDWQIFFDACEMRNIEEVIVGQPAFLEEINNMFSSYSLDDWKSYLSWKLICGSAKFLSEEIAQKNFSFFGTILSGAKELRPRWKRVIMLIDQLMGDALGKLYVERHFSVDAKKKINDLTDHLMSAYEKRVLELPWMSAETKNKAVQKLHKVTKKLGYPDKWIDYSSLKMSPENSYLENYFLAVSFESKRWFHMLDKPVDRREWFTTPPTVNAYYYTGMNDISFPAGILQSPFFDPEACDAVNYAAIGSVIGHELTHGFDDQGGKFDGDGNMKEWWTKEDRDKFNEKTETLVKQYDGYKVIDNLPINGRLTLGENIADLGGLSIALEAFNLASQEKDDHQKIDGFTPKQLFFLSLAQCEQSHTRPEEQRRLATIDPHSPARFRVNGIVSNMDEFYTAFDIKPGDNMYLPPEARTTIW